MTSSISLSGVAGNTALREISMLLRAAKPDVIGIASAFVSVQGVETLSDLLIRSGSPRCRLVAGTDNAITHPAALYLAKELGWDVRLGSAAKGIFHPKLLIGGRKFTREGRIFNPNCLYVGSSNLTASGFERNLECGLFERDGDNGDSAADAFATIWQSARLSNSAALRSYAAAFAESARRRSAAELRALGVSDSTPALGASRVRLASRTPKRSAFGTTFAVGAWAGLQSFTGEYQFQVEFPQDAGQVIRQLIARRRGTGGRVDVFCPEDEQTRQMKYYFYESNGMFRLNIPNDFPGVDWARSNRDGIALVEAGPSGGDPLRLELLPPGTREAEIIAKSVALSTWGRTSTREYGWY